MKLLPTSLQQSRDVRQTFAASIVSFAFFTFGFIKGWMSLTVETHDLQVELTSSQMSWVISGALLGGLVGLLPAALLMDYAGRKGTLLLLNTLPVAGWILTSCASGFPELLAARMLTGSWMGVALSLVPIYIGETTDPSVRSFMNTLPTFMMNSGTVVALVVGANVSYRTLPLVGLLFSLANWILLLFVPESPYFYTMKRHKEKCIDALKWLNVEKSVDEEFHKVEHFVYSASKSKSESFYSIMLKKRTTLKTSVVVITANALMPTIGGIWIIVAPIIIPKKGFFSLTNYDCATVLAVVMLLCSARPKCLYRFGNKTMLICCISISGLFTLALALWWFFESSSKFVRNDLHWVPFCFLLVILSSHTSEVQPIVSAFKGELLPTEVKAVVSAVATAAGLISISIQLGAFNAITDAIGKYFNFVISGINCVSLALLTVFCIIETKGKSLEEIQNELNCGGKKSGVVKCNEVEKVTKH